MTLADTGRLDESAEEATRALQLLGRETSSRGAAAPRRASGETGVELMLLLSHGDALTALGRKHEAAQTWRQFLSLATSPELVDEALGWSRGLTTDHDDTDGSEIIDRVRAKLAALTVDGDQ